MAGDIRTLKVVILGNSISAQNALRAVGAESEAVAITTSRLGRAMGGLGGAFSTLGKVGAGAMLGVGYESVKLATQFEASMARVVTQANAPKADLAGLKRDVLALGGKTAQTPNELADGLYHLESAGFRGKQALDLLAAAAQGATIGNSNLGDTTQAMIAVTASGIKGVNGASDAMAILNTTVGIGDMKMEGLAKAMSTGLLPAARSVGIGMSDVSAALATITDNATPPEEAATRLRMTFSLLANHTPKAEKALGSIGLTQSQLATTMRGKGGLVAAVLELKDHLEHSGSTAVQQSRIIAQAFGGGKSSSAIQTLITQSDRLVEKSHQIGTAAQRAAKFQDAWKATTETFSFRLKALRANLESVGITIGNALIPSLTKVVGYINAHAVGALANMKQTIQKVKDVLNGPIGTALKRTLSDLGGIAKEVGRIFLRIILPNIVLFGAVAVPVFHAVSAAVIPLLKFVADHQKVFVPILAALVAYKGIMIINTAVTGFATAAELLLYRAASKVALAFGEISVANAFAARGIATAAAGEVGALGAVTGAARVAAGSVAAIGAAAVVALAAVAALAVAFAAYNQSRINATINTDSYGNVAGGLAATQRKWNKSGGMNTLSGKVNYNEQVRPWLDKANAETDPEKRANDQMQANHALSQLLGGFNGAASNVARVNAAASAYRGPSAPPSLPGISMGGGGGGNYGPIPDAGGKGGGGGKGKSGPKVPAKSAAQILAENKAAEAKLFSQRISALTIKAFVDGMTGTEARLQTAAHKFTLMIENLKYETPKQRKGALAALTAGTKALDALVVKRIAVTKALHMNQQVLAGLVSARDGVITQVRDKINESNNIMSALDTNENADNSPQAILARFQKQVQAAIDFGEKIKRLGAAGLNAGAIRQIVDAGAGDGGNVATALLAGGAGAIGQVNSLTATLATQAQTLGTSVGDQMYQAGINSAKGLVAGLQSQQAAIEAQMLKIAAGMTTAIKKALGIKSPSRVMQAMGLYTAQGLSKGIVDGKPGVQSAMDAIGAVRPSQSLPAGNLSNKAQAFAAQQGNTTVSVTVQGTVQSERDLIRAIQNGLQDKQRRNYRAVTN